VVLQARAPPLKTLSPFAFSFVAFASFAALSAFAAFAAFATLAAFAALAAFTFATTGLVRALRPSATAVVSTFERDGGFVYDLSRLVGYWLGASS
jgi:hypothetical protein